MIKGSCGMDRKRPYPSTFSFRVTTKNCRTTAWPVRMWSKEDIVNIYGSMEAFREEVRKGADYWLNKTLEQVKREIMMEEK